MFKFSKVLFLLLLLSSIFRTVPVSAQEAYSINQTDDQHIFSFKEIEYLVDSRENLTIQQVSSATFDKQFRPSEISTPNNNNLESVYWYRIKIRQ